MSVCRVRTILIALVAVGMLMPADAVAAAPPQHGGPATVFPTTIHLPDGFQPEGIEIGALPYAYIGSLTDGSIYRVSLVTGRGKILSEGPGTQSVGLELDAQGRLFVAGGEAGDARVVNSLTGKVLADYQLTTGDTFINDVTITGGAAWFTDSFNPVLYKLPLGRWGTLPGQDAIVTVPITGDYEQVDGFNANGISDTPDGKALLVAQTATGLLFRVDPATGEATTVDLGGQTLPFADGILREGRTLYVVNSGQVSVVKLDRTGRSGTVIAEITDPRFDSPTTVAAFGNRLYVPNARFDVEPTPETEYTVVAVRRH